MTQIWGKVLALAALTLVLLVSLQGISLFLGPGFLVINETEADVEVTAHWRDRSQELGVIGGGGQHRFRVNDEAAMRFVGRYPDGREVASEEIYFSGGTAVEAVIGDDSISVRYEFEE